MLDKAAYIGMNGAQSNMNKLSMITNNLANVNTTGFRADAEIVKPYQVDVDNMQARVYSSVTDTYTDFRRGSVTGTGRELDVAIEGDGFFAIQSKTGKEGYTRAGSFQITKGNFLATQNGELVLGSNGPINLPPAEKFTIGPDGTISAKFVGSENVVTLDRLKLTNPATGNLQKGSDGYFYTADGTPARQDLNIKIIPGALESSNVNAIETLTQLIDISRSYEINTNLMKTMSEDASIANQILDIPK